MDNKLATVGQYADVYIVSLALPITQAKHRLFFGSFLQISPQFAIPATAATWPHERLLQNIDVIVANSRQWWVKRKQTKALAASKRQDGNTADKAEAACLAYYKASANLAITAERMLRRKAHRSPALRIA